MTALPILYSFRRCPYAIRARMAIAVSGVQVELREVMLRDKPPEMLEASAKGTVPVLVMPDGRVLEESLDIMHWTLARTDPENWLAHFDAELITANDGPFKHALDRYKYPHRYDLPDGILYREAGVNLLANLDAKLRFAPFLGGDRRSFTEVAIFPFVRQFAATDRIWFDTQPLPALQRWLSELLQSELFANVMTRYPPWKTGSVPTMFP